MRHRLSTVTVLASLLMLLAPTAVAKGPTGASIEGDGIQGVLVIDQPGELGQGTAMSALVERIGFFHLVFDPMTKARTEQPTMDLGAERLLIHWDMGDVEPIVQELYLRADGGPVTHVAPGQSLWEDSVTVGGWMRVTGDIATPLMELGVDEPVVGHLVKQSSDKAAPTMKIEPVDDAARVVDDPAKQPVLGEGKTAASPQEQPATRSGSSAAPGVAVPALVAVALGLMGVGLWIRMRRPAVR